MKETFEVFKFDDGSYFTGYGDCEICTTDKLIRASRFGLDFDTHNKHEVDLLKGKFVKVTISDEEKPTCTTRKEPANSNGDTSTDTREGGFGSTDGGNHSKVVQDLLKAHKEGLKVSVHGVLSQEDLQDLEGLGYLVSHDFNLDEDTYNNFWLTKAGTSDSNYRANVDKLLDAYAVGEGCADYELMGTSSVLHHLPAADVQQLHELGYKVVYQDAISYTMIYLERED